MTYLSDMKDLRFETKRIIPLTEMTTSRRGEILKRLQNDMVRDFTEQMMSKMDLRS